MYLPLNYTEARSFMEYHIYIETIISFKELLL